MTKWKIENIKLDFITWVTQCLFITKLKTLNNVILFCIMNLNMINTNYKEQFYFSVELKSLTITLNSKLS